MRLFCPHPKYNTNRTEKIHQALLRTGCTVLKTLAMLTQNGRESRELINVLIKSGSAGFSCTEEHHKKCPWKSDTMRTRRQWAGAAIWLVLRAVRADIASGKELHIKSVKTDEENYQVFWQKTDKLSRSPYLFWCHRGMVHLSGEKCSQTCPKAPVL